MRNMVWICCMVYLILWMVILCPWKIVPSFFTFLLLIMLKFLFLFQHNCLLCLLILHLSWLHLHKIWILKILVSRNPYHTTFCECSMSFTNIYTYLSPCPIFIFQCTICFPYYSTSLIIQHVQPTYLMMQPLIVLPKRCPICNNKLLPWPNPISMLLRMMLQVHFNFMWFVLFHLRILKFPN